jgi:hypothetical protein
MDTYENKSPTYDNALTTDSSASRMYQTMSSHASAVQQTIASSGTKVEVTPAEEVPLYKLKVR